MCSLDKVWLNVSALQCLGRVKLKWWCGWNLLENIISLKGFCSYRLLKMCVNYSCEMLNF